MVLENNRSNISNVFRIRKREEIKIEVPYGVLERKPVDVACNRGTVCLELQRGQVSIVKTKNNVLESRIYRHVYKKSTCRTKYRSLKAMIYGTGGKG